MNITIAQSDKEKANTHFNNQEWKAAADSYLNHINKNEGDSSDYYNLAVSKSRLSEHKDAIKYFKEAQKRNFSANFTGFGIAKSYALMKDETGLMASLNAGAKAGLATVALLKNDPAFTDYQENPQFMEAMKGIEKNAYPCLNAANYRHFDFWIGEWDVMVNGNKVGENSITMAQGGCAIHENYTTAGNYAGQSINYFDPIDKKWHQHWVGSGGDVYNYLETKREEGLLQFQSKFMGANGQISLSRLTFTLNEDGSVRQFFEGSTDNGETWTPAFDGHYVKKK